MTLPILETGRLFTRLRGDCPQEWHAYVRHPFLAGLADGTLRAEVFRTYLVQDYLYLLQYARAYALAIYKDGNAASMRGTARLLAGLLDTELGLHIAYCAERRELRRNCSPGRRSVGAPHP
nr:hypothetical protein [uncultured Lichenicoccus sp.]